MPIETFFQETGCSSAQLLSAELSSRTSLGGSSPYFAACSVNSHGWGSCCWVQPGLSAHRASQEDGRASFTQPHKSPLGSLLVARVNTLLEKLYPVPRAGIQSAFVARWKAGDNDNLCVCEREGAPLTSVRFPCQRFSPYLPSHSWQSFFFIFFMVGGDPAPVSSPLI